MEEGIMINSSGIPATIEEPFKVYVRIRPFLDKEILKLKRNNSTSLLTGGYNLNIQTNLDSIFTVKNKMLYISDIKYHKKEKKFFFNNIFTEKNNNKDVFDISIKPIINNIINGYNSTALAYGVTGTGKTHTIFGDLVFQNGEEGIAIKACNYLFNILNSQYFEDEFFIKVSYIEIYNENVIDLLNNDYSFSSSSLMIIEDPNKGVYCPNAKEFTLNDCTELKKIIAQGNKRRTMAPTNQNKFSSRSHAILQISLERKSFNEEKNTFEVYYSKFLMVDLAGSERGGIEKGKRREEGANINKSLFTLGSCINILSDTNKSGKFIPYRDSKLTRLLKDSLGGSILTVMLVCVSPSVESYAESLSSLNYATRAKKIKKKIYQTKKEIGFMEVNNNINFKNNNNDQYEEIIGSLKNEIFQLKNIIKEQQNRLRIQNKSLNNDTLNLEDSNIIKDKQNTPNCIKKFFLDESSNISSIQMNNSQINFKINNNINNNNNIINTSVVNSELINSINEINLEKYRLFFEEIKDKDFEINELKKQIDIIKNDKNNLELFLQHNHITYDDNIENAINKNGNEANFDNPEKIYILIKKYYDKFLEIINDKLIENIERNMILKCNIKEITELNKNNIDHLEMLNKQLDNYKKNENFEEHDCECDNINEQIKHLKNTIKENLMLKNEIIKTYNDNMNKKKVLKQILLCLLDDKRENSNKLINILKDKEKLVEMNKEFKKKIETYLKIQKKKDNDINIVQRQVELLRAQLKEKEKKIIELKKNKNNSNNNYYNHRNNSNSKNKNINNINLYYIKKNKNNFNNFLNKGKRSISCVRNWSNINNIYNKKLKKIETKNDKKDNTYIYCYDASNDESSMINNYIKKKSFNKNIIKKIENTTNKKKNNKHKSKSEENNQDFKNINVNNINENNNYLFKKIILNNKDDKVKNNIKNIKEGGDAEPKRRNCQNDNNINNRRYSNESNTNNYNVLLINYNNNNNEKHENFIIKKENEQYVLDNTRNNKKSNNISQKRYEKFMNNHNNNSHNNHIIKEDNFILNISRKINTQINKKLSLNEARYEKKMMKNEKIEKQRDLSMEINHAHAEYFINSFKGMKINQNTNEYFEKSNSNNFKVNNINTQDSQTMNNINIINNLKDKSKINNQNKSINMDANFQIETKENDTTNFKTDQSKILKTDDMYQDLVNSLKYAPFNRFKNK